MRIQTSQIPVPKHYVTKGEGITARRITDLGYAGQWSASGGLL